MNHHDYHNFLMFRDVPECSGMFHVPGLLSTPNVGRLRKDVCLDIGEVLFLRVYGPTRTRGP